MSKLFEVLEELPESESKTSNEWFTPPSVIQAVKEVLGSIDLDPASCAKANETVQAKHYFTKEQNGLMHPWDIDGKPSRVFLNPPYGKTEISKASNLSHFTRYLIDQYRKDNVKEAILLIPANTATSWFEPLWEYSICFPTFRIRFLQPDGMQGSGQSFGTCLVYLGSNAVRFIEVFLQFGPVVTPDGVHRRPQPATQPTLF